MKRISVLLVFVIALLVVGAFGCSKSMADDYYPTDEGMVWEYQKFRTTPRGESFSTKEKVTNFRARQLNNVNVWPRKWEEDGSTKFLFINKDKNGFSLYAIQAPSMAEPKILDSPIYLIRFPINKGTKWEFKSSTTQLAQKLPITINYEIDTIDDVVTVPAGTFEKCLKIKGYGRTQKDMGRFGVADISKEHIKWYAPGVGWIKEYVKESSNIMALGSGMSKWELVSYKKQ